MRDERVECKARKGREEEEMVWESIYFVTELDGISTCFIELLSELKLSLSICHWYGNDVACQLTPLSGQLSSAALKNLPCTL